MLDTGCLMLDKKPKGLIFIIEHREARIQYLLANNSRGFLLYMSIKH